MPSCCCARTPTTSSSPASARVDGSGLDLLGRTTRTAVPLKRIFAAAPERLQLLGPRLAPFKVQRTINYPIDLEELWLAIAQVTGGPNDETDGTIERVVLDERGIPSSGTTPRAPIPPRPPAPLGGMRVTPSPLPSPTGSPRSRSASAGGRYATARLAQPAPEPPLRAPPRRRARHPRGRPPRRPLARHAARRQTPPPHARAGAADAAHSADADVSRRSNSPRREPSFADWTPEAPSEDDFAQIAAQARLGVQRKVVDEASRRKTTAPADGLRHRRRRRGRHRVPHREILRPRGASARDKPSPPK